MKKNYTKAQFLEDVKKEARALRKNATKQEIDKLDFQHLSPSDADGCIYGQMTGTCYSERAIELISKCCKRYFRPYDKNDNDLCNYRGRAPIETAIVDRVNGSKVEDFRGEHFHYSSIETYIMCTDANNGNLIDYLKGKRNDLVL